MPTLLTIPETKALQRTCWALFALSLLPLCASNLPLSIMAPTAILAGLVTASFVGTIRRQARWQAIQLQDAQSVLLIPEYGAGLPGQVRCVRMLVGRVLMIELAPHRSTPRRLWLDCHQLAPELARQLRVWSRLER